MIPEPWRGIRSGKAIAIPRELWDQLEGPKPPEGFEWNGATAAWDSWFLKVRRWNPARRDRRRRPRILEVSLDPATAPHDWVYSPEGASQLPSGATKEGRREGDTYFARNCLRCVAYRAPRLVETAIDEALLYWWGVRVGGAGRGAFEGIEDYPLSVRWWDRPDLSGSLQSKGPAVSDGACSR